ncbi:MAG TPA: DUF4269 domain-containing protein [Ohtaekwangia sp.]|uniref:DUF4269 domain-containing protein n=1 Tax=Ohtaekwangia sp. TaxID=2066019 RepID=UPI002F935BCA
MLHDFKNVEYLLKGSLVQQRGWQILQECNVLKKLAAFHAVLTGTLPLDLFIAGKSDLDIVCFANDLSLFEQIVEHAFASYTAFEITRKNIRATPSVIARFQYQEFLFELFCQAIPVEKQYAFRHLCIEYSLLQHYGKPLKEQVLQLKQAGIKTEPAFAQALGLSGDPYESLLLLDVSTLPPLH